MRLMYQDSFLVRNVSDFNLIKEHLVGRNLMIVSLGMLEDDGMDKDWWSYFHPDYVRSTDWVTIFVRNESHGFISDLFESAAGKFFNCISEKFFSTTIEHPARVLEHIITNRPNKDKKTVIIAHSQGGILTVNALNSCKKEDCKNIKCVFMGSANWTLPKYVKDCICLTTKLDYVCIPCGRYFLPSTIKLKQFKTHDISCYSFAMHNISKQVENPDFKDFDREQLKKC